MINSHVVSDPGAVSRDAPLTRHHPDLGPLCAGEVLMRISRNGVLILPIVSFLLYQLHS